MDPNHQLTRRGFLRVAALTASAAVLSACSPTPQPTPSASETIPTSTTSPTPTVTAVPTETPVPTPAHSPVLTIAHITDMHIEADGKSREHFSRAMRQVLSTSPTPDFVLNTGDCVMDVLYADEEKAQAEWDTFQSVLSSDFPIPVFHAIGNHDVWGWGLSEEKKAAMQDDPLFGKGLAMQRLGLTERYYSFDQGGWRFIVLDSVHPREIVSEHPYTGKLDDEQYAWLEARLEATPPETPVCIASHIPIFGASGLLDSDESSGNWLMPGAWQHIDGRRIMKLLWKYPNVRVCLSGHAHQVEELHHHNLVYINSGAICGSWWNGSHHGSPPGYNLVRLFIDGSVESEFMTY